MGGFGRCICSLHLLQGATYEKRKATQSDRSLDPGLQYAVLLGARLGAAGSFPLLVLARGHDLGRKPDLKLRGVLPGHYTSFLQNRKKRKEEANTRKRVHEPQQQQQQQQREKKHPNHIGQAVYVPLGGSQRTE